MRNDKILFNMLKESDALLEGHFLLSSGYHSDKYVQCAKLTQYPKNTQYVAKKLADFYADENIDIVVGGAFGGIIVSYEIAKVLGVKNIFAERVDGEFAFRRGFEIGENDRVLIAEDVCTTGKSIREVRDLVLTYTKNIVGCAVIIDRNEEGGDDLGIRKEFLLSVDAKVYSPDNCPLCDGGSTPYKPGSRGNK